MPAKDILVTGTAGMTGSFLGNAVLGLVFTSAWVQSILYDPSRQSRLFIELTPTRDVAVSVAGLIVLGAIHGWLYRVLARALPGRDPLRKGLFWGGVIWAMYWLPQEWFIYHTLLREPLVLNAFKLVILLAGSLAEGVTIALLLAGVRGRFAGTAKTG